MAKRKVEISIAKEKLTGRQLARVRGSERGIEKKRVPKKKERRS